MIISFEGLPGCRKDQLYQLLKEQGIEVKSAQNPELFEMFLTQPDRYALSYEIDQLTRFGEMLTRETNSVDNIICLDSLYALKEVYVEYLMSQKILARQEIEVFHRLHHLLKLQPDIVIYFYGDLEKCYQRSQTGAKKWSFEEFKGLYAQYEWVFDGNNCFLKIFKINIEDDPQLIMKVIQQIFKQIKIRSTLPPVALSDLQTTSIPPGFQPPDLNNQPLEEKTGNSPSASDSSSNSLEPESTSFSSEDDAED